MVLMIWAAFISPDYTAAALPHKDDKECGSKAHRVVTDTLGVIPSKFTVPSGQALGYVPMLPRPVKVAARCRAWQERQTSWGRLLQQ